MGSDSLESSSPVGAILQRLREKAGQLGELLVLASQGKPKFVIAANRAVADALEMPEVVPGAPVVPWSAVPAGVAGFLNKILETNQTDQMGEMPLLEIEGPPERAFSVSIRREDHASSGRSYFYFGFIEVTQWLNVQESTMDARRMESIGSLASGVAHDFNNVIMAIQGHAEFLQMRGNVDQETNESLERIIRSCASGTDLTRSLLGFARRQKLSMDTITVGAVVKDVVALCQRALGPRFKIEVDPALRPESGRDPFVIHGCFSALSHCLLNLLNNARDAMPEGGKIHVLAEKARGRVILRIRDSGQGIPPEVLPKIFDPFFTTKRSGKGTGLGLSMVQGIMQQHGGGISIESEVGKGTTVILHWPALDPALQSADVETATDTGRITGAIPGQVRTAFLIEDDPLVMNSISRLLQGQKFKVQMFLAAQDALDYLAQGKSPEVVFCDYSMPEMDGMEFIRRSVALLAGRGEDVRVRFILVSGFPPEQFDAFSKEFRHVTIHLLQKPFSAETLQKILTTPLKKFQRRITSRVHLDVRPPTGPVPKVSPS
ncbi:MAG: hypothetical protein OHK005_08570 [Candidatus Methylacidiphilales bacterium]